VLINHHLTYYERKKKGAFYETPCIVISMLWHTAPGGLMLGFFLNF